MSAYQPDEPGQGQEGLNFAKALRECLACGVILIEGGKKLSFLTREAELILGLNPDPSRQLSLEVLPKPLQSLVRETLASGKPVSGRPMEVMDSGRGTIPFLVSALPVQLGNVNSAVLVMLNDVTSVPAMEGHLQRLEHLANVGTLAASMAHEIKNALVAGKTFIELLLEQHQESELVEVVRRELSRIDAIVTQMLNFASPARPAFAPVSLHTVLDHSLDLVQPQLKANTISLRRSFAAAPDRVSGDDYELQQAFVNLLLNALEAMGPKGSLTVATETLQAGASAAPSPHLRVTIKDTGGGILPENMGRLFEPFFTTKSGGTGLGLAITHRLLQEHGGTITAESRPGEGTTFQVLLPALDESDG